jgi:hypothetical protein
LFLGECAANPEKGIDVETLRTCCNPGYARARCSLAAEADADAVSFLMKTETMVAWAIESNHHPVAVGTAEAAIPATGNLTLDAQIAGFAAATKPLRP